MTPAQAGDLLARLRFAFPEVQMTTAEREQWISALQLHTWLDGRCAVVFARCRYTAHPSLEQFLLELEHAASLDGQLAREFRCDPDPPPATPETTRASLAEARAALRRTA